MAKKKLIMTKALSLFAENGIEATSIQQITQSCGISKGAFYLSFKSKDELIIGLIDYFINESKLQIERSVNGTSDNENVLYHFYMAIFKDYEKHSNFVKLFMKEQFTPLNIDIIEKLSDFNNFLNKIIFSIIERQFKYVDTDKRADLTFLIKGFIKQYAEIFFLSKHSVDFDLLCRSLVEKTTIIADYSTIHYISADHLLSTDFGCLSITKEQLDKILLQKMTNETDPIIQESLQLLHDNLQHAQLSPAILQGLLNNLNKQHDCTLLVFLYENYISELKN